MTAMGDMNGDTLKCKLSGDMSSVFVDLEGECNISSSNYFSGEEEVYTFEGSVTADTRNKKNDVYLMMQGDINHEELFSFSLTNKATRKLVPQKEIVTPKKSKNLGEFIGELQEEMY